MLEDERSAYDQSIAALKRSLVKKNQQIDALQRQVDALSAIIMETRLSTIWKLTAPLRCSLRRASAVRRAPTVSTTSAMRVSFSASNGAGRASRGGGGRPGAGKRSSCRSGNSRVGVKEACFGFLNLIGKALS